MRGPAKPSDYYRKSLPCCTKCRCRRARPSVDDSRCQASKEPAERRREAAFMNCSSPVPATVITSGQHRVRELPRRVQAQPAAAAGVAAARTLPALTAGGLALLMAACGGRRPTTWRISARRRRRAAHLAADRHTTRRSPTPAASAITACRCGPTLRAADSSISPSSVRVNSGSARPRSQRRSEPASHCCRPTPPPSSRTLWHRR
jgi:hypothetical protein